MLGFFLQGGMARHNVIYGSLDVLIALMTWIYMAGSITIFGAHIASAVARFTRLGGKRA